jgi:hypothetical protein
MKSILVYPLCWSLFWIGDVASRIINRCPSADDPVRSSRFVELLAATYQRTMGSSYRLQTWAEGSAGYSRILPWHPPEHDELSH